MLTLQQLTIYLPSFSAAGIVKTSVIVTGVQVCSRIFMVWFITNSIRQVILFTETQSKSTNSLIIVPVVFSLNL